MKSIALKEACSAITDGTHYSPAEDENGTYPFITVKDIDKNGTIDWEGCSKISTKDFTAAENGNSVPEVGDVLFSKDGTIGKVHLVTEEDKRMAILSSLAIISPNRRVINEGYLASYMASKYCLDQAGTLKTGSALRRIVLRDIKKIKIPLPSLDQQKKIAAILDAADAYRQKTKALLTKYDELTQSLFLDMFGDLVNNQKGWDYVEFGDIIISIRYGTSSPPVYSESGIPFIRATNVKNGGVSKKGMVFISHEEASKIEKCKLEEGDLIIVRSGANTGDCCRIPSDYEAAYGGFDIIIKLTEPNSTFYNFMLSTDAGRAVLKPLTRRAGQPHLNSKQIQNFKVFDVPVSLKEKFANRLYIIESQKAQTEQSLQKAEDLFNSLLQRAFKGSLDLKSS